MVYAKAGVHPAAAIVRSNRLVIDHKLYWMPVSSDVEAQFLISILNSETARSRVEVLQSEGQFGPRDFDKVMFSLPIPLFDEANSLHVRLATCAQEAETIAAALDITKCRGFKTIRRLIRKSLQDAGMSEQIDLLVSQLLRAPKKHH